MYKLVLAAATPRSLRSLVDIVNELALDTIICWRLKSIRLYGTGRPFGISVDDFEASTRANDYGVLVGDDQFQSFLRSGMQVIDGELEGCADATGVQSVVRLSCEDATQWELFTDSEVIYKASLRMGFRR